MFDKILAHKTTLALAGGFILLVVLASVLAPKFFFKKVELPTEEVELPFDPNGPYALLLPRRDGNAVILNMKRVGNYDGFSYELTYQSENEEKDLIDRGVTGSLTSDSTKSEYSQEILFGTCSKGNTWDSLHCVFDKGIENGDLNLKIKEKPQPKAKVVRVFKMATTWHFQKPDVALGIITSADGHFSYKTDASKNDLVTVGYTLVNDLTGAPKLPDGKGILGKVYAFNIPEAKEFPAGAVSIELPSDAPPDAKIAQYKEKNNSWILLDTKIDKSKVSAQGDGAGIYTVLTTAK